MTSLNEDGNFNSCDILNSLEENSHMIEDADLILQGSQAREMEQLIQPPLGTPLKEEEVKAETED